MREGDSPFVAVDPKNEKLIDCTLFKKDSWQYEKGSYPFNYYITGDGDHVLEYALAGFSREEVTVTVEGNKIMLSAKSTAWEEKDSKRKEVHIGIAKRSLTASWSCTDAIDTKRLKVKFIDGLLIITFPVKKAEVINIDID